MLALEPRHLGARPELLLDVVADLVRDHVCPGEVAGCAELRLHVPVEAEVQIDALVGGAVERADRRRRVAAPGGYGVAIQHNLGSLEAVPLIPHQRRPRVQGVREDVDAEGLQVALGILRGRDTAPVGSGRRRRRSEGAVDVEAARRRAAGQHLDHQEQDHSGDAEASGNRHAAAHREPAAPAAAADVDHVRAPALSAAPAHGVPLPRAAGADAYGQSVWSTARMLPAGSLNQAIEGPRGSREIPFASCSKPS